jgi:valyl-tRNA synthetase
MENQYNVEKVEKKWQKYWEKEKIYKFDAKSKKEIFSIDTPPPYASSGHLHVGHALHYTQFEIVARAMRLLGREVYFPPGFDDNGLPTEKYVEEKLGIDKSKISRAEFRKICLQESSKVEKEYTDRVFRKLGHSYDWSLLYTTIGKEAQRISQTAFLRLIKKGDCYRKEEPVIWCPKHETALAQAEVEDLTRQTKLNYIDFDVADGKREKITIATTRPEFLPACVGVFVHPKDERHKNLVGRELKVPLFKHKVKVRTDEKVDREFGTGIVMVCTFGDSTDIGWWKKHKLELRSILTKDGKLNEKACEYRGFGIEEARERILRDLKEKGRLRKQEPLQQTVGSCWRCNTPIEYIVTKQWFIKALPYKKELIKRGREVKWKPSFMRIRFENWVKNLGWDWVISRQRYYGVPIPVWYCDKCNEIILPQEKNLPLDPIEQERRCKKCGNKARPDNDVFDTWMTSSQTPEIACRWLENPHLYGKLVPMCLRPQANDIIRTWAFYTILKSHLLFNRIPWKNVMIGTYVLDEGGKGMHKSKGNAVWVDELIERYGVDAFRYWVASASLGFDLPFKEKELVAGKRFLTKLWNASRFVLMNLKGKVKKPRKLEKIDSLMLCELRAVLNKVRGNYENYDAAGAKREAENFFWHAFCDNYLEIIKRRVYAGSKEEKQSALYTLYFSLLTILKIFAPITPFITEEIYQGYFRKYEKDKSIHISCWPKEIKVEEKKQDAEVYVLFLDTIRKIRQKKSKANKSIKAEIILSLEKNKIKKLKEVLPDLLAVTNAKEIKEGKFKVEFI